MEMRRQEPASADYTALMQSDPVSRLRTEYRSLKRQLCLSHLMTVLLLLIGGVIMFMFQAYASDCKENKSKETQAIEIKSQALESHSRDRYTLVQKPTPFTRLSIAVAKGVSGPGNVTWRLITTESLDPDHTKYFALGHDNESLIVLCDGTYKVSLQMMYRGPEGQHVLSHEIHHYTDRYPKFLTLLTYMETVNQPTNWSKTLFSEGIFSLKAYDSLKVWTKDRSLIDRGGPVTKKTVFVAYPHFQLADQK